MSNPMRRMARWAIATLLVSLPLSYLFYEWRYGEHEVLKGLSYDSFRENLDASQPASLWTYFLYVLLTVTATLLVWHLLVLVMRRVFPDAKKKVITNA